MSSTRALSESQVQSELAKMQAFIEKEAKEKATEIRVKADEEYQIEKASLVRSELNAIDGTYASKFSKAQLTQQIAKSTIANNTRLKLLSSRESCLEDIFDAAKEQLKSLSKNKAQYTELLSGLIQEGLYALMEKNVTIKVRSGDVAVAKDAAKDAAAKFQSKAELPVNITVDEKDFLSDDIAGGVLIVSENGKISVNNSLDERLNLLSETALPAIRLELFGPSATRKFFN